MTGARRPEVLLFTQQTIGLGARKTSMVFLAEAFGRMGFDTGVVTVQLSWLTALARRSRVAAIPRERRGRWYAADGLRGYVWIAPIHPMRLRYDWLNRLTTPALDWYGRLLPRALRDRVRSADLIVVESCAAVALLPWLRRLAPNAVHVYSMSDRLEAVGMHPGLDHILQREAAALDLIRVPAAAMRDDFAAGRIAHIPHGLDKAAFRAAVASPYPGGINAVLGGDMMLDRPVLSALAAAFPYVTFHCFGRVTAPAGAAPANMRVHGEVPFPTVAAHIRHADVGLALYRRAPGVDYLAQSSLKNLQYSYCGLPIVTPAFVAAELPNAFPYEPGDAAGAVTAFAAALAARPAGRVTRDAFPIRDWDSVAHELVDRAADNAAERGARLASALRTPHPAA